LLLEEDGLGLLLDPQVRLLPTLRLLPQQFTLSEIPIGLLSLILGLLLKLAHPRDKHIVVRRLEEGDDLALDLLVDELLDLARFLLLQQRHMRVDPRVVFLLNEKRENALTLPSLGRRIILRVVAELLHLLLLQLLLLKLALLLL